MTSNSNLSWRGGWPQFTWLALASGVALLFAGFHFRGVLLCAAGGAIAGAGLTSLRRRGKAGELRITETGVESGDGRSVVFSDIIRISNHLGVRCPVSRETEGRDCWIEGADGTHLHVPAAAGPDRRAWISSLSRWLEPVAPELPEPLKAAWAEGSRRHGAAVLRGARVVPGSLVMSRSLPPYSIEILGAAAGVLLAGGTATLAGFDGSRWIALALALLLAFAGGAGLLLRRLRIAFRVKDPGGLIISPDGIRVMFQKQAINAPWSEVRGVEQQGPCLRIKLAGQSIVLPPVFSENAAEMERFVRQHLR